jgi:hypothetical protein
MALVVAGVSLAAGGIAPSDEVTLSPSTSLAADTQTSDELITDTTGAAEVTSDTMTTEIKDGDEDGDETTDETTTQSTQPRVHPSNFGGTVCSLRHAGDHTPAAVLKGHKVPGYTKKVTTTTTSTTTTEAPPAA